jgi:hypothetical protein
MVQLFPSLQPVPSGSCGYEHTSAWQLFLVHGLSSSHSLPTPTHLPLAHLSPLVQALPSLQIVLSATGTYLQPVGSQTPEVQGLLSSQTTGVPTHNALEVHLSSVVHGFWSLQVCPVSGGLLQTPLTHVSSEQALPSLQLPQLWPFLPHCAPLWEARATHALPVQQPVQHVPFRQVPAPALHDSVLLTLLH